ncbi:hypothetical protein [Corynebacterium sp. AOP12-C2-36]|uniref:hypothetical protein n=1 Tax=Corynebacterium sp. AOP12-C2-36 TaxID=3457723 RepID=UPI004033A3AE
MPELDFNFNGFPGGAPTAQSTQTPQASSPAATATAPSPQESDAQSPSLDADAPAPAEDKAEEKNPASKKAPAKKTTAKKDPAKKTAKASGTDLDAAVSSLIEAGEDTLSKVSPSAAPLEVYRGLDHLVSVLGADTLDKLGEMVAQATRHMESYRTLIVATSPVDEDGNGSFDGYSIHDGDVVLD